MAFNMKDDFDSDANEKEVEQFGIWVKKAPEDVIDTPSGDTNQNSPDSLESDDSFNENEISDTSSFMQDLPEPDFDGISDLDTNENITDTEQITDSDFSLDTIDIEDTESADNTEVTDDSAASEQPAFSEPEPAPVQQESSFQDFQEEDSAENWEPLDDAPNFNYPSVDNITVPPLEEPSETEIENSMQSADAASEQQEEAFDAINLTEDSSFDKLETETADTSAQDDDIPDFDIDEPIADEADDDSPINLDDSFDLPDFGSTPETEDYGNSENAEPIELTDDLMNLPDFGSTPDTEDFGIVDDDIEENSDFSPIEPEDSPLSEISDDTAETDLAEEPETADNIEADISTDLPPFESISGEETAEAAAEPEPAETKDDFDTAFDSESISEPAIDGIVADAGAFSDAAQFADIEAPEPSPAEETPAAEDSFVPPEVEESKENVTEELSLDDFLSDSGEIDVSDEFGLSSGDSTDVTDDFLSDLNAEFGGSSESKSDVMDEEPIDIDLEFDDKFAADVQTDASENIEDESNFDELFGDSGDSSSVEDNFDDMFAAIQDESAPNSNAAPAPSVDSLAEFDEVTEFDDFLSSDSGPDIETEKAHSNKVNKQIDYDITVSQDDVNKTKQTTVEVSDDYETAESIPLYGTETDADGNKVAFIPKAEDENVPQKAALEKSEDDDFYENLFADAENMEDSTTSDVSNKDTPPFDISSSVDDEEIVPISNSTEEQTMKEEQDMDITDKTLSDSPEVETSQLDDLTDDIQFDSDNSDSSGIVPEIVEDADASEINSFVSQDDTDNIIDVPDISLSPSDTTEDTETEESPALYDEPEQEALQSEDTFEPENLNIENDDESLAPPEISDEAPVTEELSEDLPADSSDFEIPALDEDETSEAPALSDEILTEDEIPASEQPEQIDEEPVIQEETAEAPEDIVIPTLNEGDEDFVDAAALADSLAETDKLESESTEPAEFSEAGEPDDLTPTFDDITPSKENSDNDLPSFDDITTDTVDNNFIAPGLDTADSFDTESSLTDDSAEEPVAENDISNASLYNSILSETFPEASEDDENETDKNLLDIADNSEYTEDKEDEHNMDFDENNLDSGITEQSTTGAPEQTSNISEAVLKEISNELSMLRSEISLLKQELANVRHDSLNLHDSSKIDETEEPQATDAFDAGTEEPVLDNLEQSEEAPVVVESESSTGFFDGDVEDETIALSGDELSNILNTADFTEEFVDNTSAAQSEISDEVPTAPETMDFDEQTLEEPGDLEIQELEQDSENEEISVPNVDDIIVDSDDDGFVANIEPETEDSISNDELQYLSEEPKAEEIYDAPAEITEEASEPEALEVETVEDSEQEAPVEETEEVVLEGDVGPFSEADETPTEAVFESDQWNEGSAEAEAETPAEEAAPAAEETIEPAAETAESDGVDSMRVKAEQFADADQKDLKEEIKSVLLYMDQLLENLPDEKIEEFAQSSYFETYKKLFKELGIS